MSRYLHRNSASPVRQRAIDLHDAMSTLWYLWLPRSEHWETRAIVTAGSELAERIYNRIKEQWETTREA